METITEELETSENSKISSTDKSNILDGSFGKDKDQNNYSQQNLSKGDDIKDTNSRFSSSQPNESNILEETKSSEIKPPPKQIWGIKIQTWEVQNQGDKWITSKPLNSVQIIDSKNTITPSNAKGQDGSLLEQNKSKNSEKILDFQRNSNENIQGNQIEETNTGKEPFLEKNSENLTDKQIKSSTQIGSEMNLNISVHDDKQEDLGESVTKEKLTEELISKDNEDKKKLETKVDATNDIPPIDNSLTTEKDTSQGEPSNKNVENSNSESL